MNKEREDIINKARSKRKRRAKTASPGKAAHRTKAQEGDPNATLTEKVVDLAQGAAAQVGNFVKAAAHKITATATKNDSATGQEKPKVRSRHMQ